jgi:purine nucleoside permease
MKKIARKLGLIALIAVYLTIFAMPAAHAYIDPSTTTYLIQAIAGIAVAAGSVGLIYWRRMKKKLNDKMGIDLDKNKERDADFAVNDEEKGE